MLNSLKLLTSIKAFWEIMCSIFYMKFGAKSLSRRLAIFSVVLYVFLCCCGGSSYRPSSQKWNDDLDKWGREGREARENNSSSDENASGSQSKTVDPWQQSLGLSGKHSEPKMVNGNKPPAVGNPKAGADPPRLPGEIKKNSTEPPPLPGSRPGTTAAHPADPAKKSVKGRLRELKQLREEGLISKKDYDRKRKEILDSL